MKLQQFLALPIGTELKGFKKRFVVKSRDTMDGIEQPSLVDIDTAEPLFGAIYIPHLLSFESQVPLSVSDAEDEMVAEVDQGERGTSTMNVTEISPEISTPAVDPVVEPAFDPMVDVEDYTQVRPSFASDDACLMAVNSEMIKRQPTASQYAELLKAL